MERERKFNRNIKEEVSQSNRIGWLLVIGYGDSHSNQYAETKKHIRCDNVRARPRSKSGRKHSVHTKVKFSSCVLTQREREVMASARFAPFAGVSRNEPAVRYSDAVNVKALDLTVRIIFGLR